IKYHDLAIQLDQGLFDLSGLFAPLGPQKDMGVLRTAVPELEILPWGKKLPINRAQMSADQFVFQKIIKDQSRIRRDLAVFNSDNPIIEPNNTSGDHTIWMFGEFKCQINGLIFFDFKQRRKTNRRA